MPPSAEEQTAALGHWADQQLREVILPFWVSYAERSRSVGRLLTLDGSGQPAQQSLPQSAVLASRLLWTFSVASRRQGSEYRPLADWAYGQLQKFVDPLYGGVFFTLDQENAPLDLRKHSYAQAFAIYGLSEYAKLGHARAQEQAKAIFQLLEQAHDPGGLGYREASNREWSEAEDSRLSSKEPPSEKSLNTLLHLLEAFTNLLETWPDPLLRARLTELTSLATTQLFDSDRGHFWPFFDRQLRPQSQTVSFGHDIEAGWLILRAAELLGFPELDQRARAVLRRVAEATLAGIDQSGGLCYEQDGQERSADKHWWVQAEALVGFLAAYQETGTAVFWDSLHGVLRFTDLHVVDRIGGDWHRILSPSGVPYQGVKVGPWECPYHQSRACWEVLDRSSALGLEAAHV